MFRSIRFRLAVWYTFFVALTFVVISGAIYLYISRTLATTLDQAIAAETDWVVARLEHYTAKTESREIFRENILEHTSFFPLKEYVEIWDPEGHLLYHSPNLGTDTLARYVSASPDSVWHIETVTGFRNHDLRLALRTSADAKVILAMPMENIIQPVRQLIKILIWLGPLVIVLAIAVGMGLAKKSFSNNQMKQFSADASHELRTPLAVMRTELERALSSHATVDELKSIAANCLDETLRMTNIVSDLLFLARADAGQEVVRREPVLLHELIRQTYDESVIIASTKSINVSLTRVEEATILGEEPRLRQMLLNLVDNAVKYNHDGGTIGIGLTNKNGFARIVIADSGIGIPEPDVSRIFDRFYRVDRARSREVGGTGLGLSIVHWTVQAHGGSISVKSTLQKGSEFSVVLPLAPAE